MLERNLRIQRSLHMPFCPQCGIDNPSAARYCDQCGAALVPAAAAPAAPATIAVPPPSAGPVCAQCGAGAIVGEAFCDNCGAPLNVPPRPMADVPVPPYSSGLPPQTTYPA